MWFGQIVSDFGDGMTLLGLLILTQRLTGSTVALAGVAIAATLPMIIFGIPAGALVDRMDRRHAMIIADLGRAAAVAGFMIVRSPDLMWLLYGLAFVQASIGTLFTPAKSALIPLVVPEDKLLAANTISQMSRVVANLAGTAVLGVIASFSTYLTIAFGLDALTYILSAVFITSMSMKATKAERLSEPPTFLKDLTVGLATLVRSRTLLGVLMAGGIAMLGLGAVNVLMVPLVVDVLGAGEAWFGAISAAQVAGMLISGSAVAILAKRFAPTRLVTWGMIAAGIAVGAIAGVATVWQLGLVLFIIGIVVAPVQAGVATLAQILVADELRGRVNSALNTVISLAMVVSQAFAGLLAAGMGVELVFVVGGALTVVAGIVSGFLFTTDRAAKPDPAPMPVAEPTADPVAS
jgi:MFS family permease